MEVKGFRHKEYEVYPAGQQPLNDDGSPGKWMALASIARFQGVEVPVVIPVSWYPPGFDTEEEAAKYAATSAIDMIDKGRCKI